MDQPLHELLSRDMLDVYVGSENTHWILHEKLLIARAPFFEKQLNEQEGSDHELSLPDEEDAPFQLFVGWLYSGSLPTPKEEKDLGALFELYLMAEKWAAKGLVIDVLNAVRGFYHTSETYPGLRRVQYIYANTEVDSPMRQLLVNSIARMLVLGDGIAQHWDKALRKNGQLAVDIILAVQRWRIEEDKVPDAREDSVMPIMEESDKAKAIKQEGEGEETLVNGDGEEHEEKLSNGVNGHDKK